ncbi:hydrogenase iron-sulfur subunit [Candidatus Dependentiae bacterium]|nr:hydrogenase iron-sulfur subunit [Candidatus Dependentiae bacterium]
MKNTEEQEEEFFPKIIGFLCRWCSYAGADLAGVSRLQYPPTLLPIKVMCSSRVDPVLMISTFLRGADGVLVAGCHPGDCHYQNGNYYARRRFALLKSTFQLLGLDADRLRLSWISASEGPRFAKVVTEFSEKITKKGSNLVKREIFI